MSKQQKENFLSLYKKFLKKHKKLE